MKVLFAVNDENVSEEIVRKYQKDYKEIISYKNVYYFNAIIKEMQRDKSYDRIVIGEDLEPFANNNYETIDKFLFEKLDNISDEATDNGEKEAQIILICSDRRTKSDKLLVKLFGIGIYSAIIGKDRSIEEVCRLINNPRTKKEAKQYYRIESEDVNYEAESDADVNEKEIQSILKHYKSLGKDEDKYVESFDNIASQYTDAQLRIIIKFLPINVRAVLEQKSLKYQQIVMFGDNQYKRQNTSSVYNQDAQFQAKAKKNDKVAGNLSIEAIENRVSNPLTGRPIIIPGASRPTGNVEQEVQPAQPVQPAMEEESVLPGLEPIETIEPEDIEEPIKKGRGRPKKIVDAQEVDDQGIKRGRGRPKKNAPEDVNLFGLSDESEQDDQGNGMLPGLDDVNEIPAAPQPEPQVAAVLPGMEEPAQDNFQNYGGYNQNDDYNYQNQLDRKETYSGYNNEIGNLLSSDKKIVAFVGSPKNGTSFIVNNLATLFSSMGINTAILDLTENKNSFYIYTKNEEELRKTTYSSIKKLKEGIASGLHVNKNLSVYTSLPGEEDDKTDAQTILKTLANNHNIVLLDCDFNTSHAYFDMAQEIFLVQSMDILTIQPLTAFLRDLKNDGILKQEKIKIVINKFTKIRGLNERVLVGGMAFYNAPSMSFMTELFNKESIKVCTIPLDVNTYVAYLEAMVSCDVSLNHYSKIFMQSLKDLGGIVYPLIGKQTYSPMEYKKNKPETESRGHFSENMNNTLEQMNRMKNM